MKRIMTVAVLLLMIATSLNAGTLAVYTSTVDLAVLAVSAKRFVLGVNQGSQSEFDLKIAPGEMVSYYFDVTNAGEGHVAEVDLDILIQGSFHDLFASVPGISAKLLLYNGQGYAQVAQADGSGVLSYSQSSAFSAGSAEDKHFILCFEWSNGESAWQLFTSQKIVLPLTLYVRGTQHIS